MSIDLESWDLQAWGILGVFFLVENIYKFCSTSFFPISLCILVLFAPTEQERTIGFAVTSIPETACGGWGCFVLGTQISALSNH